MHIVRTLFYYIERNREGSVDDGNGGQKPSVDFPGRGPDAKSKNGPSLEQSRNVV